MKDVARCKRSEACIHLCQTSWDVEAALHSFYNRDIAPAKGAAEGQATAWSSGGAKLKNNEVECPICRECYDDKLKSIMTPCCFQVLCEQCHRRLTDANARFSCPFCRGADGNKRDEEEESSPDDEDESASVFERTWRRLIGAGTRRAERVIGFTTDLRLVGRERAETSQSARRRRRNRRRIRGGEVDESSDEELSTEPTRFQECCSQVQQLAPACLLCAAYIVCSICCASSMVAGSTIH